jgi:hypothetical protein
MEGKKNGRTEEPPSSIEYHTSFLGAASTRRDMFAFPNPCCLPIRCVSLVLFSCAQVFRAFIWAVLFSRRKRGKARPWQYSSDSHPLFLVVSVWPSPAKGKLALNPKVASCNGQVLRDRLSPLANSMLSHRAPAQSKPASAVSPGDVAI